MAAYLKSGLIHIIYLVRNDRLQMLLLLLQRRTKCQSPNEFVPRAPQSSCLDHSTDTQTGVLTVP